LFKIEEIVSTNRNIGLCVGEISAQTLKEVCFDRQRYKRITVSDAKATEELLEVLQGKSILPRKQFIYNNAKQLGFNFT